MAAKDHTSRSRFAVACGVLSRCVRAEADAGLPAAAAHAQARPATTATATPTASTMLLMPGADVAAPGVIREEAAAAATPSQAAQLKIVYGGGVLVFDDVPADRAAELLRLAARARHGVPVGTAEDVPVARKASLQRFMEKRRDRLAAQAPYGSASRPAVASKGRRQEGDAGTCWLGLGIPRGQVR